MASEKTLTKALARSLQHLANTQSEEVADLMNRAADRLFDLLDGPSDRQWQPISTAPKDGTEILACWPKRKLDDNEAPTGEIVSYAQCVTAWQGFWIEPDYLEAHGAYYFEDEAFAQNPTHWMPLCPPPENKAKRKLDQFEHMCPSVTGHRGGVFVCQLVGKSVSQDSYCEKCNCADAIRSQ